jgi:hypothetical protein
MFVVPGGMLDPALGSPARPSAPDLQVIVFALLFLLI